MISKIMFVVLVVGAMPAYAGFGETIKKNVPLVCKSIGDNAAKIGAGAAVAYGCWELFKNYYVAPRRLEKLQNGVKENYSGELSNLYSRQQWLSENKLQVARKLVENSAYKGAAAYTVARFYGWCVTPEFRLTMSAIGTALQSGTRTVLQGMGNHAGKIGLGAATLFFLYIRGRYEAFAEKRKQEQEEFLSSEESLSDEERQQFESLQALRDNLSKEASDRAYKGIAILSSAIAFISWGIAKSSGYVGSKI